MKVPNKVRTISQFLPPNIKVKASVGHIAKIKDSGLYNLGIDVKGNFDIDFVIDDKKKETVKELKELVSRADIVYVATDPDREGEAIAYHLKNFLNIPVKKFKRVTYHEVTKKAVLEAIDHPGKLDENLADAALARASLDKIVGYRLSPIARNKVGCRSVGRCQSPALKLIVEREEEINNFIPKTYYEIWLPFIKDKKEYKAQYKGLIKDSKNKPTIEDKEFAEKVVSDCKGYPYVVHDIQSNDRKVSPKPPFTTSTFQQEVSSKLGYSVKTAMTYAQHLFEGINISGQHVALVTYLRTDSTEMDPEFKETLKTFIKENYGKEYLSGDTKKAKKSKNAQDGHECFRVIDLTMTPERLSSYIADQQMIKVYTLIYNRTVASMMSEAVITDVDFIIKNGAYKFVYSEHSIKFPGFYKVYDLEEDIVRGLDSCVSEKLDAKNLELKEKKTSPPKRYSEATLVKKLEDLGIGRPSTFATIIGTLLDPTRGYCEEQGKALAPTEKGIKLSHFLDQAFPDIVNYDYSAKMEESLDKISKGDLGRVDYLKDFYSDLENQIKGSRGVEGEKEKVEEVEDKVCPQCGRTLVKRHGRFGDFLACPGWPKCRYTEKIV